MWSLLFNLVAIVSISMGNAFGEQSTGKDRARLKNKNGYEVFYPKEWKFEVNRKVYEEDKTLEDARLIELHNTEVVVGGKRSINVHVSIEAQIYKDLKAIQSREKSDRIRLRNAKKFIGSNITQEDGKSALYSLELHGKGEDFRWEKRLFCGMTLIWARSGTYRQPDAAKFVVEQIKKNRFELPRPLDEVFKSIRCVPPVK